MTHYNEKLMISQQLVAPNPITLIPVTFNHTIIKPTYWLIN